MELQIRLGDDECKALSRGLCQYWKDFCHLLELPEGALREREGMEYLHGVAASETVFSKRDLLRMQKMLVRIEKAEPSPLLLVNPLNVQALNAQKKEVRDALALVEQALVLLGGDLR